MLREGLREQDELGRAMDAAERDAKKDGKN
jgi:hypothetical protein